MSDWGDVTLFRAAKPSDPSLPAKERYKLSDNTGNFLFTNALRRQIPFDSTINYFSEINDTISTLVLPMANFIRPGGDYGHIAEAIEKSKIERVVIVSGGAQADRYEKDLSIPEGTRRLLAICSERSKSIGVRGFYTAELLDQMGIKNVDVIGCPSVFYNLHPDKPVIDPVGSGEGVVIHGTASGHFRDKLASLYAFGLKHDADYVLQNERHLIPVVDGVNSLTEEEEKLFEFHVGYYNNGTYDRQLLRDWYTKKLKMFFDLDEWMLFLEDRRLSIGSRFHGNVASMLVGTPSLSLVFDTRTREMCEYMGLPYMMLEDFRDDLSIEDYLEHAHYDRFNVIYPARYQDYVSFLEKNGIPHRLVRKDAASQPTDVKKTIGADVDRFAFDERVRLKAVQHYLKAAEAQNVPSVEIFHEVVKRLQDFRSEDDMKAVERGTPIPEVSAERRI